MNPDDFYATSLLLGSSRRLFEWWMYFESLESTREAWRVSKGVQLILKEKKNIRYNFLSTQAR